ncbi:hypothetical protein FGO68_gene7887 [Halteria grandinella]|uniref:Uncharacterized protein n=1 Tax=Halteria grandinella TaxID=5974 RepID=A0A8J8P8Y5_HALGN|nr:hypothetical protein FGO68_gene7887 [Halteria grandinella]
MYLQNQGNLTSGGTHKIITPQQPPPQPASNGGITEFGFVRVIMGIYYGGEQEQREIVYRLQVKQFGKQ